MIEKKPDKSLYDLSTLISYIVITVALFFMLILYIYQMAQTNVHIKENGYSLLENLVSNTRNSLQKGERNTFQNILNETSYIEDIYNVSLYTPNKVMTYTSNEPTVGLPFLKLDGKFQNPNLALFVKTNGSYIRDDWSFSEHKMKEHENKSKNCSSCHYTLRENLNFDKFNKAHIIKGDKSHFYYNIPIERYCINCHTHWNIGDSAGYLELNMDNKNIKSQSKERLKYFMIILGVVIVSFLLIGFSIKALNKKLQLAQIDLMKQANHDSLTGLFNRRFFYEISKKTLNIAKRNFDDIYLIMFDIDNFKKINDNYGHDVGDKIIIALSDTVSKCIRSSDIVARWGGEEFLILAPNTNQNGAQVLAEKIRSAIENLNVENIKFTVSIGISSFDYTEDLKIDDAIKKADIALYDAKESGKNKACLHI